MKSQQFNVLNIISKLMNEEIEITTELRNLYDKLFSIIEENCISKMELIKRVLELRNGILKKQEKRICGC